MKLLLDTHDVLALLKQGDALLPRALTDAIAAPDSELSVSCASLWEIAIKVRSGKLEIGIALDKLPDACTAFGAGIVAIQPTHVLAELSPLPATRDPFDRLLLAQAQCEGMRLVTIDNALKDHLHAWQPAT